MRAKFYTNTDGTWGIADRLDLNYLELRSWIFSGGYLVIDSKKISTVDQLDAQLISYTVPRTAGIKKATSMGIL